MSTLPSEWEEDGLRTNFWNEIYVNGDNLRKLFPHLYTQRLQKNASVSQVWRQQGWNLIFRRALNDREVDSIASLLQVLSTSAGCSTNPDKLIWNLHNKVTFTIKSCY